MLNDLCWSRSHAFVDLVEIPVRMFNESPSLKICLRKEMIARTWCCCHVCVSVSFLLPGQQTSPMSGSAITVVTFWGCTGPASGLNWHRKCHQSMMQPGTLTWRLVRSARKTRSFPIHQRCNPESRHCNRVGCLTGRCPAYTRWVWHSAERFGGTVPRTKHD